MTAGRASAVAVDLVLRWCAESLVAAGMSMDNAFVLSWSLTRLAQIDATGAALARIVPDIESMKDGAFPVVPEYRTDRVSDTTICIDDVVGHEVFAIHAGLEFAVQAAVMQGSGVLSLAGVRRADAMLAFLPQLVQQGLMLVAVRGGASASEDRTSIVTFASAALQSEIPIVDVPADLLAHAAGAASADSLQAVLNDTGVALSLPQSLSQNCKSGLQLLVIDPHRCPRESSLIKLRRADAAGLTGARAIRSTPRSTELLVDEEAKVQISRLSQRLKVFNPFQAK